MSEEKELSIIQIIQTYGVELSKSFLQGNEMMEAMQSIERITENIMVQLDVSDKDWLFDQLTSLQNACFQKMNLELEEYFRLAFIAGFNFSKEIEGSEKEV